MSRFRGRLRLRSRFRLCFRFRRWCKLETVGEAGTAAAVYGKPKDRGRMLPLGDRCHSASGILGQADFGLGHGLKMGCRLGKGNLLGDYLPPAGPPRATASIEPLLPAFFMAIK